MKKLNLVIFLSFFGVLALLLYGIPMKQYDYMASFKNHSKKSLEQKEALAKGQGEDRAFRLQNVITGIVNPNDWYQALKEIVGLSKRIHTRDEDRRWEQVGADQVGGRSRAFIFDNKNPNRCYVGSVAGGIFVSDNLGEEWRPVDSMADNLKIMSIGCMAQSINGDIYAGTGEYWGNSPTGEGNAQFYGNGIYKKDATSEEWIHLSSTIKDVLTKADNNGDFHVVIDISCDPKDNNIVYAGTTKGLFKSIDGGATWSNPVKNKVVGQVKIAATSGEIYISSDGELLKSTDDGATFTSVAPEYRADESQRRRHLRIAVGKNNDQIVYASGITSNSDLKFVIRSENGGKTWKKIGEGDAFLNPLCSDAADERQCQGWYDMCLSTHPKDDDIVFIGGMPKMYSWSARFGWVQTSDWKYPAVLGENQIHSDMHEIAFHKNSDTMALVCDGGVYMSYNSYKNFPDKINWRPKNNQYNVTQYYDMDASRYGELIGGAQDNGTQLVNLKGASIGMSAAVGGGDGFDVAISANKDYQIAFGTVYTGTVRRTLDLSAANQALSGHCGDLLNDRGDAKPDGKFDNVGFHTRIFLAEDIEDAPEGELDIVKSSFFFVFNRLGGMHISNNATAEKGTPNFTQPIAAGVGEIISGHHSKDLKAIYLGGTSGLRRLNNLPDVEWDSFSVSFQPCLKPKTALSFSSTTGLPSLIGSVFVDQKDANHVIAAQMGFGGLNKIFESTDGLKFTTRQGNLPVMPIYSCVMNPNDSKNVFVGTEFGVWETKDISVASPDWVEQNSAIGRVPVYKLKVKKLRSVECPVLYAGTCGRGFFRLPLSQSGSCDYQLKPRNPGNSVGITNVRLGLDFNIYPNPASEQLNISFSAKKQNQYYIRVYDMNGKMVKNSTYKAMIGDNIIRTDISVLRDGNYIVRLEDDKTVIGGKLLTKN